MRIVISRIMSDLYTTANLIHMLTRLLVVSTEGTELTRHGAQDGLKSRHLMHWLLIST